MPFVCTMIELLPENNKSFLFLENLGNTIRKVRRKTFRKLKLGEINPV